MSTTPHFFSEKFHVLIGRMLSKLDTRNKINSWVFWIIKYSYTKESWMGWKTLGISSVSSTYHWKSLSRLYLATSEEVFDMVYYCYKASLGFLVIVTPSVKYWDIRIKCSTKNVLKFAFSTAQEIHLPFNLGYIFRMLAFILLSSNPYFLRVETLSV